MINLIEVVPDSLDLRIFISAAPGGSTTLRFKRATHAFVIFKPNHSFWIVWHNFKFKLKKRKMYVEKERGVYEVGIPLTWYKQHLTLKGRTLLREKTENA